MAGFLTPPSKQFLLDCLVGKVPSWAGGGSDRTTYLGLATALSLDTYPTLANISEVQTPGYARTAVTWDPATSGDPVFVDNTSDIQMGPVTEDMAPAQFAFLTTVDAGTVIGAPVVTLGAASGGGTFAAGTYYWVVTAINSRGETIASNEVSATLTLDQQQVLNWGAVSGATGYNVYRGTASGLENVLVTTTGAVTTYTDTGTAGTDNTEPPAANSAAIADVLYVWELAEPVRALANKPIYVPASGLVVE